MDDRARDLIRILELERHPEGGYYREVFRSAREVRVPSQGHTASRGATAPPASLDGAATRSALTTIYFLLMEGEPTAWHSVASDEIWHFLEGAPAELLEVDPLDFARRIRRLGQLGQNGAAPVAVVPAGHWQMARTLGAFTLVGCTVGPGFDFADFKLLPDDPALDGRLRRELERSD